MLSLKTRFCVNTDRIINHQHKPHPGLQFRSSASVLSLRVKTSLPPGNCQTLHTPRLSGKPLPGGAASWTPSLSSRGAQPRSAAGCFAPCHSGPPGTTGHTEPRATGSGCFSQSICCYSLIPFSPLPKQSHILWHNITRDVN